MVAKPTRWRTEEVKDHLVVEVKVVAVVGVKQRHVVVVIKVEHVVVVVKERRVVVVVTWGHMLVRKGFLAKIQINMVVGKVVN